MGYWVSSGPQIKRIDWSGDKSSLCKLIKDNKIEIGVLEWSIRTSRLIRKIGTRTTSSNGGGRISGALQECASPSLYFKAATSKGAIDAAAQALFKSVTSTRSSTVRLSN